MKSNIKRVLSLFIACFIIFTIPVQASRDNYSSHKVKVQEYTEKLNRMQKNVFVFASRVLFDQNESSQESNAKSIKSGCNHLDIMAKEINAQIGVDENNLEFDEEYLLLINAINYIKSSLYALNALNIQKMPVEKMETIDRYSNFRLYADSTIELVNRLVEQKYK